MIVSTQSNGALGVNLVTTMEEQGLGLCASGCDYGYFINRGALDSNNGFVFNI